MTAPPRFAITPDQQDLSAAERDLRFHPCTNENPATLTRAQIAQFNRDGFLKGIHLTKDTQASDQMVQCGRWNRVPRER